jgi:arabinogalactan endo-1,4-beta-galactosidase
MLRLPACLIATMLFFLNCSKSSSFGTPDPPPIDPPATTFAKGADVGWLTEMEAAGKKFYNKAGMETEAIAGLKALGMNTIRLRVWVNPTGGWNGKADVVAKALRAKNLGMRVMIDFHYSDTWADPGQQSKPAAWAALSAVELKNAVSVHTTDVLNALKTAGVTPEWVQVGNETNNGMLWPTGQANLTGGMANYAQFVNAGYDAVKAVFPNARVILHISSGNDNGLFTWNIGGLISNGAKFDVIGMSLYPDPGTWQTLNAQCLANMNDMVSRYKKEVMVVEAGMSWDQTVAAKAFLTDLMTKVKSVTDKKGTGLLYWEPQCYGNWQGYTKGAFDNSGKPTAALDAFAN